MSFPFPAWDAFEADPEVTDPSVVRLYRFLRHMLDFTEVRETPGWYVSENTGIQRQHVGRRLNFLRDRGYIVEHPRNRADNQPRRFTLAWSAHPVSPDAVGGESFARRMYRKRRKIAAALKGGGPQLGLPLPTPQQRGAA